MRFKRMFVLGLSTAAVVVAVTATMRIAANTAESAAATTAVPSTAVGSVLGEGRSAQDLYAEATVVARVQVLDIAGDDRMGVVADVQPLVVFKSDGAPLRYVLDDLVFCDETFTVGDTYLVFAERVPGLATNAVKVLERRSGDEIVARINEGREDVASLLAELEAWSGLRADVGPTERLATVQHPRSSCIPG